MTEFDKLKDTFLMLGFDIEKYKIDELHYRCENNFYSERFKMVGYYPPWFELWLNEDKTIKKLEISSIP